MFFSASKHIPDNLLSFCEASNRTGLDKDAAAIGTSDLDGYLVESTEIDSQKCFEARGNSQLDRLMQRDFSSR